jgi:hypothetical protein
LRGLALTVAALAYLSKQKIGFRTLGFSAWPKATRTDARLKLQATFA